jgi:hypothetical protein
LAIRRAFLRLPAAVLGAGIGDEDGEFGHLGQKSNAKPRSKPENEKFTSLKGVEYTV